MKSSSLLISLAVLATASSAFALPENGRAPVPVYLTSNHGSANAIAGQPQNLKNALMLLRTEALQIRADDGGTLTADHRAYLQTKLDRLTGKRLGTLRAL